MLSSLKQRAALQSRTLVPDGGGGYTEDWQTVGHAWVQITPLGTDEKFGPDAIETRIRHRIVMRTCDDVVAGMRALVGVRSFAIHAVLDRCTANPLMTLMCEELP